MKSNRNCMVTVMVLCCLLVIALAPGQPHSALKAEGQFTEELLAGVTYRNIGPFRASAWVSDIAVPERPRRAHLYTLYVATRTGGLWKTTNNGTTFDPLFDEQNVSAIGDVTLSPSNPEIVWVGTGGAETSRSAYYGDGVYKSTDGGKTWRNMGLADSHHIARIVIHPEDPDVVYVAAMGHLFSTNEERGVFKTVNGGVTWEKVLYIDERTGVMDIAMNRDAPEILYAATYEKERYPWHFEAGGPGSGIYKTTDGGATWMRLGGGFPTGKIGRIGLDIYRRNPDIVYAVVENVNTRPPSAEEAEQDRSKGLDPQPRRIGGEAYRSEDAGETWTKMSASTDDLCGKAGYSFTQIRVDPNNDQNLYVNASPLLSSIDGGRTWRDLDYETKQLFPKMFGDVRTMWVDPEDSDRIILGTDGGVHTTYDRGKTSDFYDNLPLGEFYAIAVDMEDPYNVYGGIQDHESWKGPVNSWSGEVSLEDWVTVGRGDGMYNQVDPTDSRWLYNTSSHGGHHRFDQKLRTRTDIIPRRPEGEPPLRFTWVAPIRISPHNSQILYTGGQALLRSMNRGDDWQEISPDLTTNDPVKIAGQGNIQYCTITTISESPMTPGLLWVGTDDGRVHATRNNGATWTELTEKIAAVGGPEHYWVSRVFASSFDEGTAYVAKSGYRRDDLRPFVFKTTDYGTTWRAITNDLPDRPVNVIYEDGRNPNLLFLGNDMGVYVSIEGGERWVRMRGNMPRAVPVHDLLVHPRENDLVVGSYGRGLFITDVGPLRELNPEVLAEDLHLFQIEAKTLPRRKRWGNYRLYGDRHMTTPNERGLAINYYLKTGGDDEVVITVKSLAGKEIRSLPGSSDAGLGQVIWDMADESEQMVAPGLYTVVVEVGELRAERSARVRAE